MADLLCVARGARGTIGNRGLSLGGDKMAKARIAPVHPGVYLKELLEEIRLSQYRLAHDIGVPAMRISHLVHGKRPVTAELALRLGRYFGQSPRYWLNLQSRYDIDIAEDFLSEQVAREVRPLTAVLESTMA